MVMTISMQEAVELLKVSGKYIASLAAELNGIKNDKGHWRFCRQRALNLLKSKQVVGCENASGNFDFARQKLSGAYRLIHDVGFAKRLTAAGIAHCEAINGWTHNPQRIDRNRVGVIVRARDMDLVQPLLDRRTKALARACKTEAE